ncbi:iron-containing alcohol dehydrogenase [Collinsella aerofaciens]
MHLARCAWCRTYQTVFRIALPVLPYTEPRILEHAEDVPAVLQKRSIQHVLIVTDPGIARLGLTAPLETALASKGISAAVYAETRANPTVSNVEEAASLYRENACRAIIGFGGGSAMDCAKGVGHASRSQTSPSTRCAACCAFIVACRCSSPFPPRQAREARSRLRR